MDANQTLTGPDLAEGVPLTDLAEGVLLGHVHGESVLLARRGAELFATGAVCSHYGAPLDRGLMVDNTVRCPRHHACFSLRTGEALRAPALDAVACWKVEEQDGRAYVRARIEPAKVAPRAQKAGQPSSVVIVGGARPATRPRRCSGARDTRGRSPC